MGVYFKKLEPIRPSSSRALTTRVRGGRQYRGERVGAFDAGDGGDNALSNKAHGGDSGDERHRSMIVLA
jgi:hypothetical protein